VIRTVPAICPLCPGSSGAPSRALVGEGVDFEYRTVSDSFRFVRCEGCGTLLLDPRPADEEIPSLYPPDYGPYRFDSLPGVVRRARDLVQRRKVAILLPHAGERARVVDLGCGGGALLRLMRAHGRPSWSLAGWDFPGEHLDRVEAQGFEVIRGPVEPGLVPDASVDAFVLNQVIEHFPEPARVVEVLAAALKPGGVLVIETPDTGGLDARWFRRRYWGGYHFPRHLVLFDERTLAELVRRAGLEVVERKRLTSPSFWLHSFHHAAGESGAFRWTQPFFTKSNPLALLLATAFDLARAPFGPTSNLRIVARRPA
jgi:SAM-dependent methyltransferase